MRRKRAETTGEKRVRTRPTSRIQLVERLEQDPTFHSTNVPSTSHSADIMTTHVPMARVPFAPLDNPRLQHLANAKNRQNGEFMI